MHIGLLRRSIRAARRERNLHVVSGLFRSFLDGRAAAKNDEVSQRDLLLLLRFSLPLIEFVLDRLQLGQHLGQFGRLIDFPVLLRGEANARTVGSTTLVGTAEGCRRRPGGRDELRDRKRGHKEGLQSSNVLVARLIRDRQREQGLARAGAPWERAGRGSARAAPCRGASACTKPWRRRRRVPADSRRSAVKSFRKPGRSARRGLWSAWMARDVLMDRAHPEWYRRLRHSSVSTDSRRPGSWSVPIRSRTGFQKSRCSTW